MQPHTQDILALLQSLPTGSIRQSEIQTDVVPPIVQWLGYDLERLRLDFAAASTTGSVIVFDAAILRPDLGPPALVIEIKYTVPARFEMEWLMQLRGYRTQLGIPAGLLLTVGQIVADVDHKTTSRALSTLRLEDLEEIRDLIGVTVTSETPAPVPPDRPGDAECLALFSAIEAASTNDEKKKSLETMVEHVFSTIPGIRIKQRDATTRSSEIDLVLEHLGGGQRTLFDEFGRYALVECKNWKTPVGAREVRDFVGKLLKTKTRLGILVSRSGITGERSGTDARREIQFCYDALATSVVAVSARELRGVCFGASLHDIIDDKLFRLRFDIQ
jgi:hypothetical protein